MCDTAGFMRHHTNTGTGTVWKILTHSIPVTNPSHISVVPFMIILSATTGPRSVSQGHVMSILSYKRNVM